MGAASTTPREIAKLDIEHFSRLLRTSLDEQTRKTVERLLAEEKAKLAGGTSGSETSPSEGASERPRR